MRVGTRQVRSSARSTARWSSETASPAALRNVSPAFVEALEERRLFDGTVVFSQFGTIITITGTENADNIEVKKVNNQHVVTLNGQQFVDVNGLADQIDITTYGGNDTVTVIDNQTGSAAPDVTAHLGDGSDTITTVAGTDTLYGEIGPDSINAGDGDDHIHGGTGNDTLQGGWGNDVINGDFGDDVCYGNSSSVTYGTNNGIEDKDDIWGDAGEDTLFGQDDRDFLSGASVGADQDERDLLYGDFASMDGYALNDGTPNESNDNLDGGGGNDYLTGDTPELDSWILAYGSGYGGDDTLYGSNGADTMYGWAGNDTFYGGAGGDTMLGGRGDDTFFAADGESDTVYGGDGSDTASSWDNNEDVKDMIGDDVEVR